MQQPVLPHFPDGPLNQESLDRFSDALIEAYSKYRVTTNFRPQPIIKRIPVRIDVIVPSKSSTETKEDLEPVIETPEPAPLETVPTPSESVPTQPVEIQKCFLHPKPKASCKRCQDYLAIKKGEEPSPKKPRP